jgi:hypothetical protein
MSRYTQTPPETKLSSHWLENCVDPIVRLDLSENRPFVSTGIRTQDHVERNPVATLTTPPNTISIFIQSDQKISVHLMITIQKSNK